MNPSVAGLALLTSLAFPASAEVTANAAYMSEYIFRGIPQSDSSAAAGIDFKSNGFYLGTWGADVEQGLEVDLYGGYNGSFGDVSFGIGATQYLYTDDFDDDYTELNLSLGYGIFSVSGAIGEYDNFDGPTEDYTFVAPRVDYRGFYGLVGIFGDDFDGEYYEAGYGSNFEPLGVDWKISVIHSTDDLLGDTDDDGSDDDDNSIVVSLSKTFTLLK